MSNQPAQIHLTTEQFTALFSPRRRLTTSLRWFLRIALLAYLAGNSAPLITGQPPSWWIVPGSWGAVLCARWLWDDHKTRTIHELEDLL